MNIFVLDLDPELAAQYHCDKHVPKLCVEATQLIVTIISTINEKISNASGIRVDKHPIGGIIDLILFV